jgi:gluconolactonase
LLAPDAAIEVIASGFEWSEGPVWVPDAADGPAAGHLLFSEIPSNTVRRWDEGKGLTVFLKASGYTGPGQYSREPGSNGLALDAEGRLLSCEHGDRRISVLTKGGGKRTLADNFEGHRFNSPNDLCVKSNGDIYFTDPPYGLPKGPDDPTRELKVFGVYRLSAASHERTLLTDVMTRPNGIAFSPDEKTLYVAQSDPAAAIWLAFPVKDDGTLGEGRGRVLKDATAMVRQKIKGLPDGLKVDKKGNLWATGPGGVHVMSPDGTLLGRLETGEATSNCAFGGADGTTLFITADMFVCRVKTKVTGAAVAPKK